MSSEAETLRIDEGAGGRILSLAKVLLGNADAELMSEPEERDASSLANSSNTEFVVRDFRGIGRGRGLGLGPEVSVIGGSSGEVLSGSNSGSPGGGVNRDALDMSGDPRVRWGVLAGLVLNVAVWIIDPANMSSISPRHSIWAITDALKCLQCP